jgi:beta-lactamase regulating signal transducer with metallopeptidase domain/predicted  nucleic acid-binding Zn-ribbon protein
MMPQSIAPAYWSFLIHILDPALRSLALGGLAALALVVFRVKNASTRLAVWTGVLYAALAMPLLAFALPSLSLPVPTAFAPLFAKTTAASAAPAATQIARAPLGANDLAETFALPAAVPTARPVRAVRRSRHAASSTEPPIGASNLVSNVASIVSPESEQIPVVASIARRASASAPAGTHGLLSPAIVSAALFCVVALFLLARIALGTIFGARLVRSAETIGDCEAIRVLLRQARAAGVASAPRLAESDLVCVPVTLGIIRPVILLPAYWRNWEQAALAAVIAHEMSHIARRDALTQRLALVHRAIFWFSPLAWWLNRALANAAEEASDEAALAAGADRAFYAETLLGFFAALSENSRRVYWQGVSIAAPGQAERRVDRILNWRGAVSMRIGKSLAVGLVLFGVPVVLLAAAARPSTVTVQAPAAPAAPSLPALPAAAPVPAPAPLASAAPSPIAAPMPAPAAPMLPVLAMAQTAPAVPPPPPAAAQVPGTPVAPETVEVPDVVIDNDGVNVQVMTNAQLKSFGDLDKQMKFSMKNFPQLSTEDQQKLKALEEQLAQLRARYTENHPEVLKLQKQIAELENNLMVQVKPFTFVQPFQFQVGPVTKISTGDFSDRFVIVSGDSPIAMSGNSQDLEHATALRSKINGDFIWFQRDEKSYVIRDQAVVNQAKVLFKPEQDLGEKQQALGKQQQALGDQQRALGDKMRDVHVAVPDVSADLEKLEAQLKQLSASGGTQQQVGDVERQLGEVMRKLGQTQSQAGDQDRQIGEQMRQLGDQQRTLGDQQRDFGHQQRDAAQQARTQLKQLLDEAISKGTAQPE